MGIPGSSQKNIQILDVSFILMCFDLMIFGPGGRGPGEGKGHSGPGPGEGHASNSEAKGEEGTGVAHVKPALEKKRKCTFGHCEVTKANDALKP